MQVFVAGDKITVLACWVKLIQIKVKKRKERKVKGDIFLWHLLGPVAANQLTDAKWQRAPLFS